MRPHVCGLGALRGSSIPPPRGQKSNCTLIFARRPLRISVGLSHDAYAWLTEIGTSVFRALYRSRLTTERVRAARKTFPKRMSSSLRWSRYFEFGASKATFMFWVAPPESGRPSVELAAIYGWVAV